MKIHNIKISEMQLGVKKEIYHTEYLHWKKAKVLKSISFSSKHCLISHGIIL